MTVFNFELQRFNEGEPVYQEPAQETEPQNEQNEDFGVAIDENGEVVFDEKFLGNQTDVVTEQPQQPNMYTPEELKATAFDKVDPWRLPPELQELYKSMQAPFSRATQQLAQQKSQYDAFLAQQQPQQQYQTPVPQQQQMAPVEPQGFDRKAYVQQLFETAKGVVEQDLGERFDELNPYHQAAMVDTVTELKQQFYNQQAKQQQVQSVIGAFSSDPDWKEIDAYAQWRVSKLPHDVAEPLMQRIKNGDASALHAALTIARDELKAIKRGQQAPVARPPQQTNRPPFVEQPGSGNANELAQKPDFRTMRGKSTDELAKMVQKWGIV